LDQNEQPKRLGLDHELPDRFEEQGLADVDRHRQIELPLSIDSREELAIEHELPNRELQLSDVRGADEAQLRGRYTSRAP
jgi:hypothetical protein